jgi:hypothetical protein
MQRRGRLFFSCFPSLGLFARNCSRSLSLRLYGTGLEADIGRLLEGTTSRRKLIEQVYSSFNSPECDTPADLELGKSAKAWLGYAKPFSLEKDLEYQRQQNQLLQELTQMQKKDLYYARGTS